MPLKRASKNPPNTINRGSSAGSASGAGNTDENVLKNVPTVNTAFKKSVDRALATKAGNRFTKVR